MSNEYISRADGKKVRPISFSLRKMDIYARRTDPGRPSSMEEAYRMIKIVDSDLKETAKFMREQFLERERK